MIAAVEKRVYDHGFVILSTTTRRRIICMVQRKQADALCAAIRTHLLRVEQRHQPAPVLARTAPSTRDNDEEGEVEIR